MAYKKTYRRKRNYRRRRPNIYGTKPKFMPRGLAMKRYGQVSTTVKYFKAAGSINSDASGNTQISFLTQYQPVLPANPNRMPDIADSYTFAECYNEYKVLAIKLTLFAANVGTEPGIITGVPGPNIAGFDRGDAVTYLDQEIRPNEPLPLLITNVMTLGSARMIPTRISKFTRVLYRKKGLPGWGCCDRNVPLPDRVPDPWNAGIFVLGNNARQGLGVRPLWFFTVAYKIIFRGRSYTP